MLTHPFKICLLESGSITLAELHTNKGTTSLKDEAGSYFVKVALLGTGFFGKSDFTCTLRFYVYSKGCTVPSEIQTDHSAQC